MMFRIEHMGPTPRVDIYSHSIVQCYGLCVIQDVFLQPSDSHLVVGMTTRLLSIKYAPPKSSQPSLTQATPTLKGGTYRYFVRGRSYKPTPVSKCHVTIQLWVCIVVQADTVTLKLSVLSSLSCDSIFMYYSTVAT